MTETKNFYQQFGFHPETIGLRHRHFNIIVEPDEMDQQGGAQAGDICVRARDGAANPMDFEAVRKPNFINTLEDDFDPTYRYYWFRPLSEPMTETKDDVAGLVARLRKAAEHAGVLLVDPPKPSPMMALLNEAADALTPAPTEAGGVREAAIDALTECEEYFDNRADADCDQDGFIPNKEMRLLSVVRTARAALSSTPAADAGWQDDPASDDRWNAGVDFAMTQLCAVLDVDPASVNWDAATETLDGDVQSVIGNIMRACHGEEWSPSAVFAPPLNPEASDER